MSEQALPIPAQDTPFQPVEASRAEATFNKIRRFAGPAMKGLGAVIAPSIAQGMLVEWLGRVSINDILAYVSKDVILWNQIDPHSQAKAVEMIKSVGGLRFATVEWAEKAISKDLPAVASLFISSPRAHCWIEKQLTIIRQECEK
jgi:hypothetical protein